MARDDRSDRLKGREVTVASIVFGLIVGAVMNASITYAGLKIGFTIGGSTIAAVLGFGILRGVLRRGSILETNIAQTVASAVNIPNSGIIFTVPVLVLLGYQLSLGQLNFWMMALACVAGAILGCAFIIPVRKQMLDIERLRFPTGTAVAAILKSPGAGSKKSIVLVSGALLAVAIYLPVGLPSLAVKASLDELEDLVAKEKISPASAQRTRDISQWIESQSIPPEVVERGREAARLVETKELPEAKVDQFALAAYRVSVGEEDWSAFDEYWAAKPIFWGYSDLDWRLRPPQEAAQGDELDEVRFRREMREVDHNSDGRPDLALTDHSLDVGRLLGMPSYLLFVFAIAPFSLGAGYITGRAGLLVLAGGLLAYHALSPAAYLMDWMPATTLAYESPDYARLSFNRPIGIGMLLGGALMGVLSALPAMKAAFKGLASATPGRGAKDELGLKSLIVAILLATALLYLAADFLPQDPNGASNADTGWLGDLNPHLRSLIIAVVGVVWIWFAGIIIAQCTGLTDWSPISGMALITVVLVMALGGSGNVMGAVLIGATLCVAVTCAADMMQDLKTGFMLGAVPKRQQMVELATTGLGPIISLATILLIVATTPLGTKAMPAPQAVALEAVITGVQGEQMPYMLYGTGSVLGMSLGLGSFPGLGVLVGLSMYLPIEYILPYGLGCIANMIVQRLKGNDWAEEWGVPFCAGLIVGEALLQLCISGIKLAMG